MTTHVILDAARMGEQFKVAEQLGESYDSLYLGIPEQELAAVAPYLFSLASASDFANWLAHIGLVNSWGVYIFSQVSYEVLHRHLRRFLMVQL